MEKWSLMAVLKNDDVCVESSKIRATTSNLSIWSEANIFLDGFDGCLTLEFVLCCEFYNIPVTSVSFLAGRLNYNENCYYAFKIGKFVEITYSAFKNDCKLGQIHILTITLTHDIEKIIIKSDDRIVCSINDMYFKDDSDFRIIKMMEPKTSLSSVVSFYYSYYITFKFFNFKSLLPTCFVKAIKWTDFTDCQRIIKLPSLLTTKSLFKSTLRQVFCLKVNDFKIYYWIGSAMISVLTVNGPPKRGKVLNASACCKVKEKSGRPPALLAIEFLTDPL